MIKISKWLMPLPILLLCSPFSTLAEEAGHSSAIIETGAAGLAIKDDISRVNEYSAIRTKPGVNPYGKVDARFDSHGIELELNSRYLDSRDQTHGAKLDVKRVIKSDFSYDAFQHWLDHDRLDYLDAAIPTPASYTGNAANPLPITPNAVPAYWYSALPGSGATSYGGNSATNPNPALYRVQQVGRATLYGEDLLPNAKFSIVRREWKNKTDFTIPQLPNITVHFKYRHESREGFEQSIGMSKCTSCHITGQAKRIDESTRDTAIGATGKFGLLTLNYEFMNRKFMEEGGAPTRTYDPALSPGGAYYPAGNTPFTTRPFDNRLTYDYDRGLLRYDVTPDSEKDSHIVKAKVDLPQDTTLFASYVTARVDSAKTDEPGIFTLDRERLSSRYDSWGGKLTTMPTRNLKLTMHGKAEKLRDDDVAITYTTLNNASTPGLGGPVETGSLTSQRISSASRDTVTVGLDAVYRLAAKTTMRLGYEFKELQRLDEAFNDTRTHTIKASVITRPASSLSARASYTFKKIDEPFKNPTAAMTPLTILSSNSILVSNGPTYGIDFYDRRTADLSSQPDTVHEGSLSSTWSPSAHFSATAYYRVKSETNDLNSATWQQMTHTPGISFWYAPTNKLNFTVAYNYLKQKTENKMCQGLYDG